MRYYTDEDVVEEYGITLGERIMCAVLGPILAIYRMSRGLSAEEAWDAVRKNANRRGCDRHERAILCYFCYSEWYEVQFHVC